MEHDGEISMRKKRITLKDGRYMIFYTFEDRPASSSENDEGAHFQPSLTPNAKDERSV